MNWAVLDWQFGLHIFQNWCVLMHTPRTTLPAREPNSRTDSRAQHASARHASVNTIIMTIAVADLDCDHHHNNDMDEHPGQLLPCVGVAQAANTVDHQFGHS